ncbi:MAG: 23S rRNA (adenine(2503)-C(2))-methyltransferase RlmN [Phycisphaerae bacterium]
MDVLGMTFDEVRAAVGARAHEIKALRAEYRAALAGRGGDRMRADLLPVVRQIEDGDLIKFVQRTHDGLETESVMVPMRRHGREWKSLCVSSQIGCARGCVFCETGQMGLVRNLSVSEIVGQVVAVKTHFEQKVRNIVFMGMGEPFDNFDHVVRAVAVLNDPAGLSISCERIAISTVGRIEGIRRFAALGLRRLNLAISLNAPNDEIRSRIMPVNRLEPMGELREALLAYPLRKCQFFMIEYVLIPGVNDQHEHALQLAEYLRPLKCVVNVIPYNPRHASPWPAPDEQMVKQFIVWLKEEGQVVKRRLTKGREHMAACGQLGNRELVSGRRGWLGNLACTGPLDGQ